jgi:two-component system sensor histidine kinase YesM
MLINSNALRSIRVKLFIGLAVMTIPLISLLIYLNFYAIGVVRDQVAQYNINTIGLYMGQIDRNLNEIDKYLLRIASQDLDLVDLGRFMELDKDQYAMSRIHIFQTMTNEINYYNTIDYFFVSSPLNDDVILIPGQEDPVYARRQQIKLKATDYIRSCVSGSNYLYDQWVPVQIADNHFLFRMVKTGNVYIGALVNVNRLMLPLRIIDLGNTGFSFLSSGDQKPLVDDPSLNFPDFQIIYKPNDYVLTNGYLVVGKKSEKGNFSLIIALPEGEVLKKLPVIQRVISYMSYISAIFLVFSLYLIRKDILLPIHYIMQAMTRLRNGLLDTRIERRVGSLEFELMNNTFNNMASQIQELKINIYEEELNRQKAELRHLQLQINPHFFLNSLNIIFYHAQFKDYGLIQEMALCLINYFRYMFRSNSDFVSLEDEAKHTQNYLRIQQMRFPENLTYALDIPPPLLTQPVPPLAIQTLAENAVKYAVSLDRKVHIQIDVRCEGERLMICIRDTGKGFKEDILQKLVTPQNLNGDEDLHIGIWNLRRRLQILYKEEAQLRFANAPKGGAVVKIELPIKSEAEALPCIV